MAIFFPKGTGRTLISDPEILFLVSGKVSPSYRNIGPGSTAHFARGQRTTLQLSHFQEKGITAVFFLFRKTIDLCGVQ